MVSIRNPGTSRVQALDLLRLVAVTAVVFYHYGFLGPLPQVAILSIAGFAQYGYLGVSAFFIISGFVVAYSTEGRTAAAFAIARFSRIYPMFVFCMTLTFVTVLILAKPNFTATLMQWFSNLVIAAPAIGEPYMDGAYWSLLIEVVFYARFAVLIALGWFPRRIDMIILIWIGITFANELTLDLHIIESCSSRMTAASLLSASSNTNSIAIGGLTYPFYLLHMQMVYVIYSSDLVGPKTPATVVAIIVSIAVLSWAIWRYIEGPLHNWTKRILAKAVQNTYANERSHTQSDRP